MKIIPPPKKRTLRSYERMAMIDHGPCCICNKPIDAGDDYIGEVKVVEFDGEKFFRVDKYHVNCPWDPSDDPEEHIPLEQSSPASKAA